MTLVATEALQLGAFVKHAYPFKNLTHEIVTVTVTQDQVLSVGQPMGKITATSKFIRPLQTASDGSQTFAGIIADLGDGSRSRAYDTAGDITIALITRGPALLNRTAIETLLDSSYGTVAQRNAFFAGTNLDSQIVFGTSEEKFGTQ